MNCQSQDPEIWFNPASEKLAISICDACPVKDACLKQATEGDIEYGVWGGVSPVDRALTRWAKLPEPTDDNERRMRETQYVYLLLDLGMPKHKISKALGLGHGGLWRARTRTNLRINQHQRFREIAAAADSAPVVAVMERFGISRRQVERARTWARANPPEAVA